MITEPEALTQVNRLTRTFPTCTPAREELVRQAVRARSLEHLESIIDRWIETAIEAPKPSELRNLILGPAQSTWSEPEKTRCAKCGDSGYEPRFVLRTARTGGAGYEVQSLTWDEYMDLSRKVDWQRQTVYSSVRRCSCGRVPAPGPEAA